MNKSKHKKRHKKHKKPIMSLANRKLWAKFVHLYFEKTMARQRFQNFLIWGHDITFNQIAKDYDKG